MCACKQSPATLVLHATAKDSVKLKKPGCFTLAFQMLFANFAQFS